MDLEGLVILADDQAVADAVEIGPQRLQGAVHRLADDEHGVKGKGNVLGGEGGEVRLFLGLAFLIHLRHGLAPQLGQHPLQNEQVALAAGVHHAGLFQHGVHIGGLGQGLVAYPDGFFQNFFHVGLLRGGIHGGLGGQAGHGEDSALGGFHDGLVGGGDALLHGGGKNGGVGGLPALQALGDAAEQQGQNDAGVAPGAPQQGGGGGVGGLGQRGGLDLAQLRHGGADGHGHIGARVAVGDGEHVKVVVGLLLGGDGSGAVEHHLLEQRAGDLIVHVVTSSLTGSWNPRTRQRP